MPNPLSADIRARFEVLFAQGLTGREIGRRLMISAASASRLSQKLKQGLGLTPADNPRNTGYGICNCSISGDLGILGWWSSAWHGPEVPWAPHIHAEKDAMVIPSTFAPAGRSTPKICRLGLNKKSGA